MRGWAVRVRVPPRLQGGDPGFESPAGTARRSSSSTAEHPRLAAGSNDRAPLVRALPRGWHPVAAPFGNRLKAGPGVLAPVTLVRPQLPELRPLSDSG